MKQRVAFPLFHPFLTEDLDILTEMIDILRDRCKIKNAHVLSEADKKSDIGREGGQKKFCPQNSKNAHFFCFQVFFFPELIRYI